jgi:acetyltransferase
MGPARQGNYARIVDRLLADDQVDAVLPLIWYGQGPDAEALVDINRRATKPVVPVPTTDPDWLLDQGLPAFPDPTRAVRALAALSAVSHREARADEVRSRRQAFSRRRRPTSSATSSPTERALRARALLAYAGGRPFVLESTAKAVLAEYGIPVAREIECGSEDEAVAAAAALGGTVVLKGLSYEWPHKSDAGGVVAGLRTADQVRAGYRSVIAAARGVALESVLVQEMVRGRLELAVGLQRDPVFGAVVATGLGGPLVEVVAEPVLLHVPFSAAQAGQAAGAIAGGRITHPVRGLRDGELDALAGLLSGLGELAAELPEVISADVNPVMVGQDGLAAVDALLVVEARGD